MAALWCWAFARAAGVRLPWFSPVLLGLGTWLIYISDRLLDGLKGEAARLRERHHFYARHRAIFLVAGAAGGIFLLWLIVNRMPAPSRREDVALFAVAMLYFAAIHLSGAAVQRWLPKELAVGAVFAAATAVPAWSRAAKHEQLLPAVCLFAAICWLNCVAIERWERSPAALNRNWAVHFSTQWAALHLRTATISVFSAGAIALSLSLSRSFPGIYISCMASAALLFAIDCRRKRLSPMQLRILADAALLTPALFIPLFS